METIGLIFKGHMYYQRGFGSIQRTFMLWVYSKGILFVLCFMGFNIQSFKGHMGLFKGHIMLYRRGSSVQAIRTGHVDGR